MPYHDHKRTESNAPPEGATRSESGSAWNPERIQALINDAYKRGDTPVVLCLGLREAAALKSYLSTFFDDPVIYLKNQVYAGLKIVELRVDSHLRIETLRSIYSKSRHAEQLKVRQAMEHNRIYGSIPIRGARQK